MTLIVTDVSKVGIAMAADSMISFQDSGGNTTYQQQWKKLFKVEMANGLAGVSYWGNIGEITNERFDEWLTRKINEAPRCDLFSFASSLAEQSNLSAGNRLIAKQKSAGIHVAGFHPWSDGSVHSTFFHIHNGHMSAKATANTGESSSMASGDNAVLSIPTGSANDFSSLKYFLQQTRQKGVSIEYSYDFDARKHFEVHADFPSTSVTLEANRAELETGHLTRNGDHLTDALVEAGVGIATAAPSGFPIKTGPMPSQNIGTRLGTLIERMKTVIAKHESLSTTPMVGGQISILAICQDGTHFEGSDWKKTE